MPWSEPGQNKKHSQAGQSLARRRVTKPATKFMVAVDKGLIDGRLMEDGRDGWMDHRRNIDGGCIGGG